MPDQSTIFAYIYLLIDPRTNETRYVGMTRAPNRRLREHITTKEKCHRTHWIQSLRRAGLAPLIEVIDAIPIDDADDAERFWIAALIAKGARLTNNTSGGGGQYTLSEASRRKISESLIGHPPLSPESFARVLASTVGIPRSEEFKRKVGAASKRRWEDPIHAAFMRAAMRTAILKNPPQGHAQSDETRAKISAAMKGVPKSAETRARMSEGVKKRPPISDESRARMSASVRKRYETEKHWHVGGTVSDETRAKISATLTGKPMSAETRAKISVALKAYRARAAQAGRSS